MQRVIPTGKHYFYMEIPINSGIYQLKDNRTEYLPFPQGTSLKRMGIIKDNLMQYCRKIINILYWENCQNCRDGRNRKHWKQSTKLNVDHPADYKAHSRRSATILWYYMRTGKNTAHFVDSFGFTELPKFMLTPEGKRMR